MGHGNTHTHTHTHTHTRARARVRARSRACTYTKCIGQSTNDDSATNETLVHPKLTSRPPPSLTATQTANPTLRLIALRETVANVKKQANKEVGGKRGGGVYTQNKTAKIHQEVIGLIACTLIQE